MLGKLPQINAKN